MKIAQHTQEKDNQNQRGDHEGQRNVAGEHHYCFTQCCGAQMAFFVQIASQFCLFSSGSEESRTCDTANLNFPSRIDYEINFYEFCIQLFL